MSILARPFSPRFPLTKLAAFASVAAGVLLLLPLSAVALTWSPAGPLNRNAGYDNGTDREPEIATDGSGHWVAVWKTPYPVAPDDTGSDEDLMVSRSSDDGLSWSAPAPLNSDYLSTQPLQFPRIVHAGGTSWVAVWSSERPNAYAGDLDIIISRSGDHGATWSAPAILNGDSADDTDHDFVTDLVSDGAGSVLVAVEHTKFLYSWPSDCSVFSSPDSGATWGVRTKLSPDEPVFPYEDENLQLAALGSGAWTAVWSSPRPADPDTFDNDHDLWQSSSADNGASWSVPSLLHPAASASTQRDYIRDLKANGSTLVCVSERPPVYSSFHSESELYVWRSTDGGQSWSEPVMLSEPSMLTEPNRNTEAQLVAAGQSRWGVLWTSSNSYGGTLGTDLDIVLSLSSDDASTWTVSAPLSPHAATDGYSLDAFPALAASAGGTLIALWVTTSAPGAHGIDGEIALARSANYGASWFPVEILNSSYAVADSGSDDSQPRVAANVHGVALAVWAAEGLPDSDIRVTRSMDDGVSWSDPTDLEMVSGIQRNGYSPDVVWAGGNDWVAAWSFIGNPYSSDGDVICAQSGDDGQTWSMPALLNDTGDSSPDQSVRLASNGAGLVMAVWQTQSPPYAQGPSWGVVVRKSTSAGAFWTPISAVSSTLSGNAAGAMPSVVHTGGSNWLAAWHSDDTLGGTIGSDLDILFARTADNGDSWSATAPLNSNAAEDAIFDRQVSIASDGQGNVVAVWQTPVISAADTKTLISPYVSVLCARSSNHGTSWSGVETVTTVPASLSASFPPPNPQVASAGAGRFLVSLAWPDSVAGWTIETDIYACESADNGATWSSPARLNSNGISDDIHDEQPAICAGRDHWITAWTFGLGHYGGPYGSEAEVFYSVSEFGSSRTTAADWELFE